MNHNYIDGLSAEERLCYFSYLQSLKENSAFIQRLYICQSYSYLALKSNRDYNDRLQHVLTNGVIEVEEPQTDLFVETVLTPFDEIPTDVPIFKKAVNGKSEFYLNELKNGLYACICQSINGIQENSLSIEIIKSILIWMYAIEKRYAIDVLPKNVHIELVLSEQLETLIQNGC